jgi:hypothetical protein
MPNTLVNRRVVLSGGIAAATPAPTTENSNLGFNTDWNDNTTTNASSYATGSYSITGNALVLAFVRNYKATLPDIPTMSGNSLTWVNIGTQLYGTTGTPLMRLTVFRALGAAPTTGATTMSYGGNTQDGTIYEIVEIPRADTSGTNGSGAIVQIVFNAADSTANPNVTYAAPSSASNMLLFAYGDDVNANDAVAPVDWTEEDELAIATPSAGGSLLYQQNATIANTSVTVTATARNWGGVVVEVKPATKTIGIIEADWYDGLVGTVDGTTMDATTWNTGLQGPGSFNWGASGGGTAGKLTVAASFAQRLHNIVLPAGTVITPTGSTEHCMALDTSGGQRYMSGQPVGVSSINKRRDITCGGIININMTGGTGLYDIIRFDPGLTGPAAILQYRPGVGLNIEQTGGGTTHSTDIVVSVDGSTNYGFVLTASYNKALAQLVIFNILTGVAIPSGSVSLLLSAIAVNDYFSGINAGNKEFGSSAGTIKLLSLWGLNGIALQGP